MKNKLASLLYILMIGKFQLLYIIWYTNMCNNSRVNYDTFMEVGKYLKTDHKFYTLWTPVDATKIARNVLSWFKKLYPFCES
jgi:hypothetical protein